MGNSTQLKVPFSSIFSKAIHLRNRQRRIIVGPFVCILVLFLSNGDFDLNSVGPSQVKAIIFRFLDPQDFEQDLKKLLVKNFLGKKRKQGDSHPRGEESYGIYVVCNSVLGLPEIRGTIDHGWKGSRPSKTFDLLSLFCYRKTLAESATERCFFFYPPPPHLDQKLDFIRVQLECSWTIKGI